MRVTILLWCCLLLVPALAEEATVYKKVRPDGTVEFSDAPSLGAEPVEVPPLQTYPPPPLPKAPPRPDRPPSAPAAIGYEALQITDPPQDGTVFFDENGMAVTVSVNPPLRAGHAIALLLDGRQVARGTGTRFVLNEVYRGTHVLVAQIEASGQVMHRSEPVTFHLIQHAVRP